MEKIYEKQLKGKDGCDIKILDSDGEVKEVLASIFKEDGMDIRLTIDSDLQKSLYEQFKEDPGCFCRNESLYGRSIGFGQYSIL